MSVSLLVDLPTEIICTILLELDIFHIVLCRQVCKVLHDLVDNEATIRYRCELDVAGMEDGPSGPLGASERLNALQQYQQAWRKLQWNHESSIPMSGGHAWELLGNTLAQLRDDKRTVVFTQIPSTVRGIPEREWEVLLDFDTRDFAIDPGQDLLVALCETTGDFNVACTIHFRSMQTGLKHRLASKHVIRLETGEGTPDRLVRSYTIQICGEYIGVLFHEEGAQHLLCVWAWQQGKLLFEYRTQDETSFTFLTPTYLLVARVQEPERDGGISRPVPVLEVFDVLHEEASLANAKPQLTFRFPRFLPELDIAHICVRSDPSPASHPAASSSTPFAPAPTSRLFVISIWASLRDMQPQPLVVFVPLHTFLPFLKRPGPRDVLWTEWGPAGTRMSHSIFTSSVWVCYVYGASFITRGHALREEGDNRFLETWLHVYQFAPLELRRDAEDVVGDSRAVRAARIAMFEEPVATSLPFRRVSKFHSRTRSGEDLLRNRFYPMLAEDAIVLVHDDREQRKYTLLTL